ncbi:DUF4214 domain-containing protein [Novosphingobium sp. Rr 2-17]|uniref:DUF4214 domain-containing protein n=1 Tax=Novosphingobium sp. Rr 2-17 TaxID=555793 RepID=UPI0012F64550|nr:DUF4214 domain-containing protein [Novosphingobium sp. Rr 2-17]
MKPNVFENSEADIDLSRCPAEQIGALLDLVRFDRFLDYVYSVLLKREPDCEGRLHYRQLTEDGLPRPTIVRRLLLSREYRQTSIEAKGVAIDEFVNRAYQDILGRWPDQAGLDTYVRIAAKPNGRRKVVMNLLASDEAVRKGGGRLARITALRAYTKASWLVRLPLVGQGFARRRKFRQRLEQISLSHHLLAQQVAALRQELEEVSLNLAKPFGFMPDGQGDLANTIFQNALIRVRREA